MPQEIERKFLVDRSHPELVATLSSGGMDIRQGYLCDLSAVTVTVAREEGEVQVTRPGADPVRISIPEEDAVEMIQTLCRREDADHVLDRGVARIRIAGGEAWLTIKGKTCGVTRSEFGYAIPTQVAEPLLSGCSAVLRKRRHVHPLEGGLRAEIDVFEQIDLVLAEVEVPEASTPIVAPAWFTREVSDDPAYFNNAIAERLTLGG